MGQISYYVPIIEQGQNPICWVACMAMVTSFKTNTCHGIAEFTGGFDPSSSSIPNPANLDYCIADGWDRMYTILGKFGFTPTRMDNTCLAPSFIENILRRHGPFMIFVYVLDFPFYGPMCVNMQANPKDSHAVVLSGIDTGAGTVQIVNPWGTNTPPADLDVVLDAMQKIVDDGHVPAAYM